jgi:alkylated DNA repair dioxygenase AlkB
MPVLHALSDGGRLELLTGWLARDEADLLFVQLERETPWGERSLRIAGREVREPRMVAWVGDPGATYTYSGRRNEPLAWTPPLSALRARLEAETGQRFNSVLLNLYRDGRDSMGLHADREHELGPEPFIASLSLGATRRFVLERRRAPRERLVLPLGHGDLLLMGGTLQHNYRHGVPKEPAVVAPRINLTFRLIVGGSVVSS